MRAELNALIENFNEDAEALSLISGLNEWAYKHQPHLKSEPSSGDMIVAASDMMRKLVIANYPDLIGLIDVGSVGGLSDPWRSFPSTLRFVANFDPNDPPVETNDSRTLSCGVWNFDETRPFYVQRDPRGSSLFLPDEDYVRENFDKLDERGGTIDNRLYFELSEVVETREIACRSLDSLLSAELADQTFNFLKIDAQGAEYEILEGAEHFLTSECVGVHLELFHFPIYRGIKVADEVIALLERFGFFLAVKFPDFAYFNSNSDYLFFHRDRPASIRRAIHDIYRASMFHEVFKKRIKAYAS